VFDPALTVYNPVDRYYAFPFVNSTKIRSYERKIAEKADVIICTSEAIKKDLSPYNENCFTVTHGVDFDHFNAAINSDIIPKDIMGIRQPIIGFFGGLADWVDYDLIFDVAAGFPYVNIVLIGKKSIGLGPLESLPNVHFLGFKDFKILPVYLKQFTVCLIPYVINERLMAVDPIKLREYLALGKPVVSVDLPEVKKVESLVYIGENKKDFLNKVRVAMEENNPFLVRERIREARRNDWSIKTEIISKIICENLSRRKHY
jgi:glycosyltransferase involved in cell wall biosynthesis